MPRHSRIDYPGAVHHVYARGIEKRRIFLDDKDRKEFLRRLEMNFSRWNIGCLSWALMENHFHILIRSAKGNLSFFMRCLLTGYSQFFNSRHSRSGHLFQNRYKSRIIEKENYLRTAIRYIHLNPVRSGKIRSLADLDSYPWTGHRQILSSVHPNWIDMENMRTLFFDNKDDDWLSSYKKFIQRGFSAYETEEEEIKILKKEQIEAAALKDEPPEEFKVILERISIQTGIPQSTILGGGRKYHEVNARREILKACKKEIDVPVSKISKWLGISGPCSSYLIKSDGWEKSF